MDPAAVEFSQDQFHAVSQLAHGACGLNLHPGKKELVRARLAARLRELRLADVDSYLALLAADGTGREAARLMDVLTTNKTSFFREPEHFRFLLQRVVPELLVPRRRLRVWSAGCSTGEEAYSLAMVLRAEVGDTADVRILATDVSSRVIETARTGVYSAEAVRSVPVLLRQQSFRRAGRDPASAWSVRAEVRGLVRFARLNLMDTWPMRGPFDLICCRNVMIYFDRPTQQRLVRRFWELLAPGGYFFAGHSESFAALDHEFEYVQPAVYHRAAT
ncbi:MAG TPA: protein-glutamate O-methyltransferase CheR [Longimicrobiales bacterium]|nr:protein-glutamate O-methyltransferase CheR [Longimicrobiales bacterium]